MTRLYALALLLALAIGIPWVPPTFAPPANEARIASRIIQQNKAKYHQWRRETIFGIKDGKRRQI
jgi:hypothetical protein